MEKQRANTLYDALPFALPLPFFLPFPLPCFCSLTLAASGGRSLWSGPVNSWLSSDSPPPATGLSSGQDTQSCIWRPPEGSEGVGSHRDGRFSITRWSMRIMFLATERIKLHKAEGRANQLGWVTEKSMHEQPGSVELPARSPLWSRLLI